MNLPRLAITMGDPTGVGPETIVGAWSNAEIHRLCRPLAIGRPAVMRRAATLLEAPVEVVEIEHPAEAESNPETLYCLTAGAADAELAAPAQIDARGGQAAYDALRVAAEWALAGEIDGITTAPLNKAALAEAGHDFPGHTELLAHLCGIRDVAMMLYLDQGGPVAGRAGLGVAHVTLHTALRQVFEQLTSERICAVARLTHQVMEALINDPNGTPPRLGACALNPHGGEQGLFGSEELTIIGPAIAACQADGLTIEGPLPADTLMARAADGDFDGVVAMYHDQGHIALKLLGMHRAVNITLGLPIVRTSVAHGTAFDVAWQGKAKTSGMIEALRVAARLIHYRSSHPASNRTARQVES